jgi:hypothetical protein
VRTKRRAALGFGRRLGEGRGEYLKGQTCGARSSGGRLRAAGAISRRSPAPSRGRGKTRQMGPTCQRNGARGRLVSGCSEVGGARCLLGSLCWRWAAKWAAQRRKGGGGAGCGGRERNGPSPRQGGGEGILFHFLFYVSLFF